MHHADMRYSSPLLALVGSAAGLATAVVGYQLVTPDESTTAPSADSTSPVAAVGRPLPAGAPVVDVVEAPCERPARLRDGVCVTHVWRTVTVTVTPVPAPVAPAAVPAGNGSPVDDSWDDSDDHGDDDSWDDSDDHGDDDSWDDDHGDDDSWDDDHGDNDHGDDDHGDDEQ